MRASNAYGCGESLVHSHNFLGGVHSFEFGLVLAQLWIFESFACQLWWPHNRAILSGVYIHLLLNVRVKRWEHSTIYLSHGRPMF